MKYFGALNSRSHLRKIEKARIDAVRALAPYAGPYAEQPISLEEVRNLLDRALPPGFSISDDVIRERYSSL